MYVFNCPLGVASMDAEGIWSVTTDDLDGMLTHLVIMVELLARHAVIQENVAAAESPWIQEELF